MCRVTGPNRELRSFFTNGLSFPLRAWTPAVRTAPSLSRDRGDPGRSSIESEGSEAITATSATSLDRKPLFVLGIQEDQLHLIRSATNQRRRLAREQRQQLFVVNLPEQAL